MPALRHEYVGEASKTFPVRTGSGTTKCSAEAFFRRPGVRAVKAKTFRMSQESGAPMIWQAKAVDVALGDDKHPRHRLIKTRNRETGEVKYLIARSDKRAGLRALPTSGFSC